MVNDQVTHSGIANTAIDPKSVLVENPANAMNGPNSQQYSSDSHGYSQVSNSPPMAVLPLNPSAKLDQEPNPFEQSFSSISRTSPNLHKSKLPSTTTAAPTSNSAPTATSTSNDDSTAAVTTVSNSTSNEPLKLPPVAAMTSPSVSGVISSVPKDIAHQYAWDSLRTGPLSPSMLQRPANPDDYAYSNINPSSSLLSYSEVAPNSYQGKSESFYQQGRSQSSASNTKYQQDKQPSSQKPTKKSASTKKQAAKSNASTPSPSATSPTPANQRRKLDMDEDDLGDDDSNGKLIKKPRTDEEDEKRKNFLERNRLAALKCRQRKKQWLNNLQAKVEYLTNDNEQLQIQTNALREEIMNLKTLLLAHKDCPISQVNGFANNINPKGMGPQHQQQALLRGTAPGAHPAVPASSGATVTAAAATTSAAAPPVSMTPMYTAQSYSQSHHSPSHRHPPQQQHRLSASSSSGAQSSGLNMVMVSQHQTTAPQPPAVSSSSGVMQF